MRKGIAFLFVLALGFANITSIFAAESQEQQPVKQDLPIELTVVEEHQGI